MNTWLAVFAGHPFIMQVGVKVTESVMSKNRLLWASRRGMLELDLILRAFLDNTYDTLASEEQRLYQDLLLEEDPDLFAWLLGHQTPESENNIRIIALIRASMRAS